MVPERACPAIHYVSADLELNVLYEIERSFESDILGEVGNCGPAMKYPRASLHVELQGFVVTLSTGEEYGVLRVFAFAGVEFGIVGG
jgi:hypothetical protein